jgi:methionyl-tRNA formyltransferase
MIGYSMLLINNNRSKAYLQNLIKNGLIPAKIILLNDKNIDLPEHTENDKIISKDTNQKFIRKLDDLDISFDEKEHVLSTIEKNNINYIVIDTLDINAVEVVEEVSKISTEYIVYSGPGGTILRKDILSKGKKFIHVHPGWLPKYRGSTTIYYSMLINSEVGASVILFEEGIDEGPILYKKIYKIKEKGIDFDYVLDPLVRAKTLVEFFKQKNINLTIQEKCKNANTFYIVHPFIKHASILKYNKKSRLLNV